MVYGTHDLGACIYGLRTTGKETDLAGIGVQSLAARLWERMGSEGSYIRKRNATHSTIL